MTFASELYRRFGTGSSAITGPVHTRMFGEERCLPYARAALDDHAAATRLPGGRPRCHIGVAGFFNLDLVAVSRPDAVVLCDINADQRVFWTSFLSILSGATSLSVFREAWEAGDTGKFRYADGRKDGYLAKTVWQPHPHHRPSMLRVNGPGAGFDSIFYGFKFAQSPHAFSALRGMALRGNFAAVTLDLTSRDECASLGNAIAGMGYAVESIYTSNVSKFARCAVDFYNRKNARPGLNAFNDGLRLLAQDSAPIVLDTSDGNRHFRPIGR